MNTSENPSHSWNQLGWDGNTKSIAAYTTVTAPPPGKTHLVITPYVFRLENDLEGTVYWWDDSIKEWNECGQGCIKLFAAQRRAFMIKADKSIWGFDFSQKTGSRLIM